MAKIGWFVLGDAHVETAPFNLLHTAIFPSGMGAPPRPAPRKKGCPAPPRPAKKQVLPRPAPPRENWQNLRGGAGQSLFESLENLNQQRHVYPFHDKQHVTLACK